eukprot:3207909-Pyramimonas_sp.AAC.1
MAASRAKSAAAASRPRGVSKKSEEPTVDTASSELTLFGMRGFCPSTNWYGVNPPRCKYVSLELTVPCTNSSHVLDRRHNLVLHVFEEQIFHPPSATLCASVFQGLSLFTTRCSCLLYTSPSPRDRSLS